MHLEEMTALGTTEESLPTSSFSESSGSGARLERPHDPGTHLLPTGHSGTPLLSPGLKSCLPYLFKSPFLYFPIAHPIGIPHGLALCLHFLVTLSVSFAYSLIICVFSKFLSSTCHG